jgi:hypothetical protein
MKRFALILLAAALASCTDATRIKNPTAGAYRPVLPVYTPGNTFFVSL